MAGSRQPGPIGNKRTTPPAPAPAPVRRAPNFQRPGPVGAEVRLPTLEIFAALHGDLFAGPERPLSQYERELAYPIFGNSLLYDEVRVAVASFANAPTTLGNVIRINAEMDRRGIPNGTVIHELTHIWQFQTRGMRYMSNSLCAQVTAMIVAGTRNAAYDLTIDDLDRAGTIDRLPAEKQATLVELWFLDLSISSAAPAPGAPRAALTSIKVREHTVAQSMLRELQLASPLPLAQILEESAFGPGHRHPTLDPQREPSSPLIPIFRIDFDF